MLLCILGFSAPSLDAGAPIYPPDQPRYEHSESAWEGSELPPAGIIPPDRDFETSIRRITDPQPGEWVPHHDYAKTQAFNADGTLYRFSSVAVYDARSLERIIDLPNLYRALWSNTDPDVLFGFKQNERQVWRYRLSTGVTEVVIDLSDDFINGGEIMAVKLDGSGVVDAFQSSPVLGGGLSHDAHARTFSRRFDRRLHHRLGRKRRRGSLVGILCRDGIGKPLRGRLRGRLHGAVGFGLQRELPVSTPSGRQPGPICENIPP